MTNDLISLLMPYRPVSYVGLKPEQKICVEFANHLRMLTLEGKFPYIWFHIPNEFLPSARTNFSFDLKQKHMGKISGVPDYCFIGRSGGFFMEFKAGKGSLTPAQKIFKAWCEKMGVGYHLCRSAEEGIEVLKDKFV